MSVGGEGSRWTLQGALAPPEGVATLATSQVYNRASAHQPAGSIASSVPWPNNLLLLLIVALLPIADHDEKERCCDAEPIHTNSGTLAR